MVLTRSRKSRPSRWRLRQRDRRTPQIHRPERQGHGGLRQGRGGALVPPFKHKVENLGDEPYNGVYIGIKGKLAAHASNLKQGSPATPEQVEEILAQAAAKQ